MDLLARVVSAGVPDDPDRDPDRYAAEMAQRAADLETARTQIAEAMAGAGLRERPDGSWASRAFGVSAVQEDPTVGSVTVSVDLGDRDFAVSAAPRDLPAQLGEVLARAAASYAVVKIGGEEVELSSDAKYALYQALHGESGTVEFAVGPVELDRGVLPFP